MYLNFIVQICYWKLCPVFIWCWVCHHLSLPRTVNTPVSSIMEPSWSITTLKRHTLMSSRWVKMIVLFPMKRTLGKVLIKLEASHWERAAHTYFAFNFLISTFKSVGKKKVLCQRLSLLETKNLFCPSAPNFKVEKKVKYFPCVCKLLK